MTALSDRRLALPGIALALAVMAGGARATGESAVDYRALLEDRKEIAGQLAAKAAACVGRRDTRHAAFRGCLNWHSAVAGTWALVAYTHRTGDQQYVRLISQRLRPKNIAAEARMLKGRPRFSMPYGRAWFLRLAIEHNRAFKSEKLFPLADEVAASLMNNYLISPPDPLSRDQDNASWALIQLLEYGRVRHRADITGFVEQLVGRHFVRNAGACPVSVERSDWPDMMSVCGNWAYLVALVLPPAKMEAWTRRFLPRPDRIEPVSRPRTARHYGMNFSRAWGYWRIYKATGDVRFRELFAEHFQHQYSRRYWWGGNYRAVAHWVPQYGLYALDPLFEEKAPKR